MIISKIKWKSRTKESDAVCPYKISLHLYKHFSFIPSSRKIAKYEIKTKLKLNMKKWKSHSKT